MKHSLRVGLAFFLLFSSTLAWSSLQDERGGVSGGGGSEGSAEDGHQITDDGISEQITVQCKSGHTLTLNRADLVGVNLRELVWNLCSKS